MIKTYSLNDLIKVPNKKGWPWNKESNFTLIDAIYPKITVVTPSYNQGHFIEETIRSVLLQNYPNLEYLIIDGGSTDSTVEVIRKYEKYITYWVSEKDRGQSDAINKGFEKATGDIICWLNSDDYYYPNTLYRVANHFMNDSNKNKIIFGQGTFLFEQYNLKIPNKTAKLSKKLTIDFCDYVIQPSSFWTKSVWDKVGILKNEIHYCFDWEWFIRASKVGVNLQMVEDIFSVYRIHSAHKSSNAGQKRIVEISNLCRKVHGDEIADTYMKLNGSVNNIRLRRFLKNFPIGTTFFKKLLWKRKYQNIPFDIFEKLFYI